MMFSSKSHINLLTTLLVEHHIRHAVVCPGSRNAPIVHNLHVHSDILCYSVTDERSAGFYALGMAQALRQPVVVCVTSGTALLNLAPAVAEAYYQHLPLIILSADRPKAWIDQLEGQTLRQEGALNSFVCRSVTLPENVSSATERWHANRLVNEALLAAVVPQFGPVHINVPISEPLFEFDVAELPAERVITHWRNRSDATLIRRVWDRMMHPTVKRPLVVFGQCLIDMDKGDMWEVMRLLSSRCVTISERLCNLPMTYTHAEEVLLLDGNDDSLLPDFILYIGDMLVSKHLRKFLRRAEKAEVVMVSSDGQVHDTTMHMTTIVETEPSDLLRGFLRVFGNTNSSGATGNRNSCVEIPEDRKRYLERWKMLHARVERLVEEQQSPFSQMAVVRYFEQQLEDMEYDFVVHYANSSAVRLANIFAGHLVYVNRGVNGIEGTLSTAAGFSVVSEKKVFCVIGDLSFFYDQNALWNQNLNGNLRIILLNNGKGGIFRLLPGLEQSMASDRLVSGVHHTSAQGICAQNDVGYLNAHNMAELQVGVVTLLTEERQRPMVLEVFTDPETDATVYKKYISMFQHQTNNNNE